MFPSRLQILGSVLLIISLASVASGQSTTGRAVNVEGQVAARELASRIFEIKHRDPNSLLNAIRPLGSASKEASISHSGEFKTLAARDYPENIALIEEAIKRLDTPEGVRRDVELQIHVLIASKTEGAGNRLPAELDGVARQVESSFHYKSFYHAASITQRLRDGARDARGRGVIEVKLPAVKEAINAGYEFKIESISPAEAPARPSTVRVKEFHFGLGSSKNVLGEAQLRTDLNVDDGAQVVVGTASLKDKALVLVLSAKVVR